MIKPITLIWLGFYSRIIMALFGGSPWHKAVVGDSYYYHWIASRAVNLGERGLDVSVVQLEANSLYALSLSALYFVSTDSYFIGCLYSIFVWLLSAFVLKKILELLNADDKTKYLVFLFYALLPSSILNTSAPMREAFELLFINLIIYSALRVYLNKSSLHWIYIGISCYLLGQFHKGLYAFGGVILLMLTMSIFLRNRRSFPLVGYIFAVPFITFLSVYLYGLFSDQVYDLDQGLLKVIQGYQYGTSLAIGRANYESFITGAEGPLGLALFIPANLFQYLFEPMPWKVSSIIDIVLTFENLLRGFLIFFTLKGLLLTDVIFFSTHRYFHYNTVSIYIKQFI